MFQMFDSVSVDQIPVDAEAVAGYVAGSWPTFNTLVQRFPHAHRLSIAVNAGEDADCLDCEPGDAVPGDVPGWVSRQHQRGLDRPVVYASASSVQEIINLLSAHGIFRDRYLIWSAHYTMSTHICAPDVCGYPAADATQFSDRALGRNLDESLCAAYFFGPLPKPADPFHYDWYMADVWFDKHGQPLTERGCMKAYHLYNQHPWRNRRKLRPLRRKIAYLRDRLWENVHRDRKPDWNSFHRGWRFQQFAKAAGRAKPL